MTFLYNTGIFFYSIIIRVVSLFNKKAKLFVEGRKNWEAKLVSQIDTKASYIWFHCASLGEFEQGRTVIEAIKKQFPEYKIALTFFSPSGYEIRKNYTQADIVCYLPLDTKRRAKKFISIIKPKKVFFVKYEYWFHFINELKRQHIPLFLISAIFRENQLFFKNTFWGKWYRKILSNVEHIFLQNSDSVLLLDKIGISNYSVSGDTRFDRVAEIASGAKDFPIVEKFRDKKQLVVAGSTWKPDEELVIAFINNNPEIKFIIAPHEVSTININRIKQLLKTKSVLFSEIHKTDISGAQVLIIDSIGILSSLYKYGSLAYIGGGFGIGIHNILEAATFGLPILFGPNHKRFREAMDLIKNGGAFPIQNQQELNLNFNRLLSNKLELEKSAVICKRYILKNVGSSQIIIKKVFNKE